MTTSNTVLTTLVATATTLVVGIATLYAHWRQARSERVYDRRRSALLDAQDTALEVRNRFGEFGETSRAEPVTRRTPAAAEARRRLDDALAALSVRLTRVDDGAVVRAAHEWRDRAMFHSISGEDVSDAEEIEAWDAMNAAFGSALTSVRGVSRERARGIGAGP